MITRTATLIVTALFGAFPLAAHGQDTTRRVSPAARIPVQGVARSPALSARADVATVQDTARRPANIVAILRQTPTQKVTIQRASGQKEQAASGTVELRPGDIVGATVGSRTTWTRWKPVTSGAPDSIRVLPFRFVTVAAADTQILLVTPVPTTLTFDAARHAYSGTVSFIMYDSLHPQRAGELTHAVQFFATIQPGDVTPPSFPVQRINLPPTSVTVTTTTPKDSIPLHVRTTLNPAGTDVWLEVGHPEIKVTPVIPTIWGWGLQETPVHVTLPDIAGPTPVTVRLSASAGILEPSSVTLVGGETKDVSIRSAGLGRNTISAEGGPFSASPGVIVFSVPVSFLLATLIGGLAGTEMRRVTSQRSGKRTRNRISYFIGGVVTGFVVAVAFAIGVNLLGIPIPSRGGEAVFVVVAALASLLGASYLLKRLEKKVEAQ